MILENEVGKNGIDDKFLKSGGLKVKNLFAGCACCSVAGELIGAITQIQKECEPDWVILETTGIAYPKKIQENLQTYLGMKSRITVLVDAVRWERILGPLNQLLSGQIIGSDAVLINKTDLADEESLQKIEADIHDFDSHPSVFRICAMNGISDTVWKEVLGQ
jgi:G3E family GTPase